MNGLRLLLGEAWRSVTASASTSVAATVTVLIGMFVLGLSIALGSWVLSYTDHVKETIVVKVYFKTDATAKQVDGVRMTLARDDRVKSFDFIDKAEALKIMERRTPELVRNLPFNPLPASFEVVPRDGSLAPAIKASLRPIPAGVDKVKDGGDTAKRVIRVGKIVEIVFLVAVAVLLGASMLLIANTIRLSIFARRREIEVMKLVGATNWFVRGPFMLEGLICGLFGSMLAVTLLLLGKEVALPSILGKLDIGSEASALAFQLNALILVGTGLLLGAAGSGLTLRRFLRV
jgi:cell division transport system permease protein